MYTYSIVSIVLICSSTALHAMEQVPTVQELEAQRVIQIAHTDLIESIAISSNNKYIITGSYDKTAKIWDLKTGRLLYTLDHTGVVTEVAISNDGHYIVTGTDIEARLA